MALLSRSCVARWVRLNAAKLGSSYPGANTLDIYDIVNFCGDTIHMEFERTLAVATIREMFVRIFPGLRS